MTLCFGKYKVDIDIEKTRDFYKSGNTAEVCDCSGCANFMQAIGVFPEEVRAFFATIGVDLEKSAEIIPYNSEKNGSGIFYGGIYHVCGTLLSDEKFWIPVDSTKQDSGFTLDEERLFKICEGYSIGFTDKCLFLEKGFPEPVVQLEIIFHCPWVLDKENTY